MAKKKDVSPNHDLKMAHQGVLFAIAFLLTLFCIGTGSFVQEKDTVQVGAVAEKRYVASADTVDTVATNRLKEAAADSVGPIYKKDVTAEEDTRMAVNEVFQELNAILAELDEDESFYDKAHAAPWSLPVVFTERQLTAYAALNANNRNLFAEDCMAAIVWPATPL